ncbi:MAG: hypothetical protein MZV64_71330 [Ignavibacteriales bacterium]|nr:hypothetical protein [Ignavibacteriales bacterium]
MGALSRILNPATVFGALRHAFQCKINMNAGGLLLILATCMLIAVLSLTLVPLPVRLKARSTSISPLRCQEAPHCDPALSEREGDFDGRQGRPHHDRPL